MFDNICMEEVIAIAREAGEAIMEIYRKDFSVEYKDDRSPLTEADTIAHEIIFKRLNQMDIRFPVLSEEGNNIPFEERKEWESFWMVDPLDGTKEFIKKNGEFTVNIALIHRAKPVIGVVYAPALGDIYWAKQGKGAYKSDVDGRSIQKLPHTLNSDPGEVLTVVASKSHLSSETQAYIEGLKCRTKNLIFVSKGSSLKLCMVAEGTADIYPRLAPTMEWDTAAADAIVRESGKATVQFPTTNFLVYNKEELLNPWFVVLQPEDIKTVSKSI